MKINISEILLMLMLSLTIVFAGRLGSIIGAGIVGVALMLYFHAEKKYLYFFFILIITFILGDNHGSVLGVFNFLRFIVLGLASIIFFNYFQKKENLSPYILPFAIYALLVSLINSPVKSQSASRSVAFFLMTVIFIDVFRYYYISNTEKVNKLIVYITYLFYLIGLIILFTPFSNLVVQSIRYTGLMNNPNGIGLVSILMYCILDVIAKKYPIKKRINFKIIKIILFISIILSGSRNGLGSLLIYELSKNFFDSIIGKISLISVFILIIISSVTIDFYDIVYSLKLEEYIRIETLETASGRTEVWEVAVQEIKKEPWFGKGILYDNYFINKYVESNFYGVPPSREWSGIWNSYLSLLMDVGIIGTILFFSFFIPLYKRSHDKNLARAFLFAALISAVVESWFAASMNAYFPLFLIYFAIQIGDRDIALAKQRTLANNN